MTFPALVIFDMAGTTVEDRGQVAAAFAATLSANGITLTADQITQVRGASKREAIRRLLPRLGEDASAASAHEAAAERIYAAFKDDLARRYREGVKSIAGADAVFRRVRAGGAKVALTTGFDRDLATLLLTAIGWTPNTIDVLVCGDEVANGRPAPDLILRAMKMTAILDPDRVANVGDTALDLESAARAGVRWNIGVLSGAHGRETLERAPHTGIIQSVADLTF